MGGGSRSDPVKMSARGTKRIEIKETNWGRKPNEDVKMIGSGWRFKNKRKTKSVEETSKSRSDGRVID